MKAAADFEESFSGVAKTVDGIADSKGKLTAFGEAIKQQFRDLAKTIPVSVNELAKIGEVAGAMGIPKEKIVDFTAVMAKLGATTNLTSDQAASSIGKIQNVYQAAGVDTDRFASSLVALGNAGASTESQILAFAERMGGAAVQVNISQAEVLGWSNAMASVGLNAELGSTAWNKAVSNIGVAVDLGSAKLQGFADVASMAGEKLSAGQFAQLFKTDASEAVNRFVEGLGRLKNSGGNVTQVLNDLGMKTSGIQMTFKNLASAGDMVRHSLDLGKKAWQDNLAMEEEFNKKKATTISQLKILYNRLYDVGIALGQQLIPAFMRLMPAAESALRMLADLVSGFGRLPQPIQTGVIAVFGLAAALGPFTFAIGTLLKTGAGLLAFFRVFGLATPATATLGLASAPVLAFTAAIAGLVFALPKAIASLTNLWTIWSKFGTKALLGELGRNVNDDSLSFGKDWRVDQQRRRRGGFAPGQMPPQVTEQLVRTQRGWRTERIVGDPGYLAPGAAAAAAKQDLENVAKGLGSVTTGTEKLTAAQKKATAEAAAWKKELDRLSGREAISVAEEWKKKVSEIGGVTKLTAKDQKAFGDALWDSVLAMNALNKAADPKMLAQWAALQKAEFSTGERAEKDRFGITQMVPQTSISPLSQASLGHMRELMEVQAMAARLAAQSGPQLMLQEPQIATSMHPDSFMGMTKDPGFFKNAFGSMTDFGANLANVMMSALTGGGNVGKAIGGFLGGSVLGELGKSLTKSVGGMLGGMLGSIMGPLGTMLGSLGGKLLDKLGGLFGNKGRDLVKDFAGSFGGFDKMHAELLKMGDAGEQLWIKVTQGVGRNNPEQAQAAIEEVTRAMEAYKQAITDIVGGVNARAVNITGQADFDVVGAGALAGFALQVQHGTSAVAALQAVTPAITAMKDAMAAGNFEMTAAAEKMLYLGGVIDANKIQFENIAASGSIMQAMLQGNIRDASLFAAVAFDLGAQIQKVIDNGVPMAQVFALAQPQLQALWEAQQKWGFAVDATTQSLINEAVQQGFVGAQMKSINQQILDVLLAIGKVLGADIPQAFAGLPGAAKAAADGINGAFSGVAGTVGGFLNGGIWNTDGKTWGPGPVEVPEMAYGGIVRARPGGTLVNVGEGGRDEAIVPLGTHRSGGGAASRELVLSIDGDAFARVVVPLITSEAQRLGVS